MSDDLARQRIASDLEQTFLVEAAAGTGKTTALVGRMVSLVVAGRRVERLAALTFTDKAAGELKLRLRFELERRRRQETPVVAQRISRALAHLESARISTLHTFAGDLLRERPVEAGIDPRFSPLSEPEANGLFDEAFAGWLETRLRENSPVLRRALARSNTDSSSLRRAARMLTAHQHLDKPWRRPDLVRSEEIELAASRLRAFAELVRRGDAGHRAHPVLAPFVQLQSRLEGAGLDEREGALTELAGNYRLQKARVSGARRFGAGIDLAEVKEAHRALFEQLAAFRLRLDADLAVLLREELLGVTQRFRQLKAARGVLDFDDMIDYARRLLRESSEVRAIFAARFDHLLVDEFQDTDPSQAAIVMMLCSDAPDLEQPHRSAPVPGKLFVVGDPKQSIYRFRNADIAIYEAVKQTIAEAGGEVLTLSRSFRARADLQAFVNAAFWNVMRGDGEALQANYVPLEPAREDMGAVASVWALPLQGTRGRSMNPTKPLVKAASANEMVNFVRWLLHDSGITVAGEDGSARAVRESDICVLYRNLAGSFEESVQSFVQGLVEFEIAHSVIGGDLGGDREELRGIISTLTALEHVGDPLSVYAALRGFLFGFSDEALLDYRESVGPLLPLVPQPPGSEFPELRAALELLRELHLRRNRRPAGETLDLLLAATRGYVGLGLSPAGEYALASLAALRNRAHKHDRHGGLSYRAFVEDLADASGRPKISSSGDDAESGGVRIMTVHKAKGLEFPVVILGDPTVTQTRLPTRVVNEEEGLAVMELCGCVPLDLAEHQPREAAREEAEAVRIAYVAATRARDLLVVPIVAGNPGYPEKGWLRPISTTLRSKTQRFDEADPDALSPGTHQALWGSFEVFVDGAGTPRPPLTGAGSAKMAGSELLEPGADEGVAASDRARLEEIRGGRLANIALASAPSLIVETATKYARRETGLPAPEVRTERSERESSRPRGPRFGTLVHQVLATASLGADEATLLELSRALARGLGADESEVVSAAVACKRALTHPLLDAARKAESSGQLRREVPIVLSQGDNRFVDGVVDLALFDGERWLVIDYKTDNPDDMPLEGLAGYRRQVALYVEAIAAATKQPGEGILFFV